MWGGRGEAGGMRFLVMGLLLFSCGREVPAAPPLFATQADFGALSRRILSLEKQAGEAEGRLWALEFATPETNSVRLEGGYSRVFADGVPFFVALVKMTRAGDGHRLTFEIGNLYSATFGQPTLKISWGRRYDPKSGIGYADWRTSLRTTSVPTLIDLKPGAWTKVHAIVAPAAAAELGHIEVGLQASQVSLGRGH